MMLAWALALMMQGPPAPPARFGGHLIPAPETEQAVTGRCGTSAVTVRLSRLAGSPDRPARQTAGVGVDGTPVAEADARRLDAAVAAFGAVTHVGVYCSGGRPARLEFHGPDPRRVLMVDVEGTRLSAIR